MAVDHYENFPVASLLLPAGLRAPVATIYRFARSADDFADEGNADPADRLDALAAYGAQLERIAAGTSPADAPQGAMFSDLARVIAQFGLDVQLFHDLLSAFSQDVVRSRYATYAEVLDYCRRSANPVGRLMLGLYREQSPENLQCSDRICTALQLINFWQDIAVDLAKDRIYLPLEDLERFGVDAKALAASAQRAPFRELMQFETDRARLLLLAGAPLAHALPGRIGLELRLVVQGGLRVLEKIERVQFDVFQRRPVLDAGDWVRVALRALGMRR